MLADAILLIHFAWVAFIVLSVPLIVLGGVFGWAWVRSNWFRHIHIAMMGIVLVEAILAIECPLTIWEAVLRETEPTDFIPYWTRRLLFHSFAPSVFVALYGGFFALIVAIYILIPPRWLQRRRAGGDFQGRRL